MKKELEITTTENMKIKLFDERNIKRQKAILKKNIFYQYSSFIILRFLNKKEHMIQKEADTIEDFQQLYAILKKYFWDKTHPRYLLFINQDDESTFLFSDEEYALNHNNKMKVNNLIKKIYAINKIFSEEFLEISYKENNAFSTLNVEFASEDNIVDSVCFHFINVQFKTDITTYEIHFTDAGLKMYLPYKKKS